MIAEKAKLTNFTIQAIFGEIMTKINAVPQNIEELTDQKKYLAEIPIEIGRQQKAIERCMRVYDICDEFQFEFSNSE